MNVIADNYSTNLYQSDLKTPGLQGSSGPTGRTTQRAKHPSQRRPYVRIVRNGQVVDEHGNRIPGGNGESTSQRENVHIPLREWNYWREWAKP